MRRVIVLEGRKACAHVYAMYCALLAIILLLIRIMFGLVDYVIVCTCLRFFLLIRPCKLFNVQQQIFPIGGAGALLCLTSKV